MFDYPAIFLLIVLLSLFGYLTWRSWRSKRGGLKWAGTLLAGSLMVIVGLLLVLALNGFSKLNEKFDDPVAEVTVAGTPDQIARGRKLAHLCASCHGPNNQLPLSGVDLVEHLGLPPLGTLYAPNLTPSGNIADWTDGELIRAIREGIHRDGRSLLVMPVEIFRNLSDEDVRAIIAFLRSQPQTGGPTPENEFSLLGALLMNLNDFRSVQPPVESVAAPLPGTLEYGKYMVDIIGCRACHGDRLQGRLDDGSPGPPPGPNLTKIIPNWTEAEFMTFFNTGAIPGGGAVPDLTYPDGVVEPRMPWPMVRAMTTDEELLAIYAYMRSLPPVDGPVE